MSDQAQGRRMLDLLKLEPPYTAYNLIDINDEMFQVSARTPGVPEPSVTVVPRRRKTRAFATPKVT